MTVILREAESQKPCPLLQEPAPEVILIGGRVWAEIGLSGIRKTKGFRVFRG
jgi:hypothetical protein